MGNTHRPAPRDSCLEFIMRKILKSKFSKLIAAIKAGNLSQVKSFYKSNVNFNMTLHNGDTPLHVAVKYGKLGIVKFIGENVHFISFNDKNAAGDTPLMIAVMNQDLKLVEYLINKKMVDINIHENRGFTPFMAACANGNLQILKFLVKHGSNFKVKSRDGQTGLHRAAFYGNIEIVKYLIRELKINTMVPDKKGNLPLHLACMKLNFTCIRYLIKVSANLSGIELLYVKNKFGVKPIDILVKVMNRIRQFDEPKDFEIDQIEEYIRDKNNLPVVKREASPSIIRTKIKSATAFARLKRGALFLKEPLQIDNSFLQSPIMSPNESAVNLKAMSPDGSLIMLEKKSRDIFEDELGRNGRESNGSMSDVSPSPYSRSPSPSPSLGSIESSPKNFKRARKVRISSLAYVKEVGPTSLSRVKSSADSNVFSKSKSNLKFSVSSSQELKGSSNHISPAKRLRFAFPIEAEEED